MCSVGGGSKSHLAISVSVDMDHQHKLQFKYRLQDAVRHSKDTEVHSIPGEEFSTAKSRQTVNMTVYFICL
jgi:hypothetical protein